MVSIGNLEVLKRDVQMTSAVTGIRHSEYNGCGGEQVHFLQIWVQLHTSRLVPKYFNRHFTDAEKTDRLLTIVAPVGQDGVNEERKGSGPTPIHSHESLNATILTPGKSITYTFPIAEKSLGGRKGYVHLIQTSGYNTGAAMGKKIRLSEGLELAEGDRSFVYGAAGKQLEIENVGSTNAELLVFVIQE
ncbi:hypothetical protein FRB95_011279 [Tulasnella sp. JGI-2019a]|nr:hypothetical protein FRB95_011279 [Tulasnella sp. JGI-2019a]